MTRYGKSIQEGAEFIISLRIAMTIYRRNTGRELVSILEDRQLNICIQPFISISQICTFDPIQIFIS